MNINGGYSSAKQALELEEDSGSLCISGPDKDFDFRICFSGLIIVLRQKSLPSCKSL